MRLNFGCGSIQPDGWVNVDRQDFGQEHVADVLDGLPFADGSVDYIVANHSLPELDHHELQRALPELRRVLVPGGVLRILVPDLVKAFEAYQRNDYDWFPQADDLPTMDERLCTFIGWFGAAKSQWTFQYARSLLDRAGFGNCTVAPFGQPSWFLPADSEIATLDDREVQALIIEARK